MVDYKRVYNHPEFKDFLARSEKDFGLDPKQKIDMNDPMTRMVMTIILTNLTQGRNLYAYDQFIKGNALSAGVSPDTFDTAVNPVGLGFENGTNTQAPGGGSGFVNPASAVIASGGSSAGGFNISPYIQLGTAAALSIGGGVNLDAIFGAGTTAAVSGVFGGGSFSSAITGGITGSAFTGVPVQVANTDIASLRVAAYVSTLESGSLQGSADVYQSILNRSASGYAGGSIWDNVTGQNQYAPISAALYGTAGGDQAAVARWGSTGVTQAELQRLASGPDDQAAMAALAARIPGGNAANATTVLKDFQENGSLSQSARATVGSRTDFVGANQPGTSLKDSAWRGTTSDNKFGYKFIDPNRAQQGAVAALPPGPVASSSVIQVSDLPPLPGVIGTTAPLSPQQAGVEAAKVGGFTEATNVNGIVSYSDGKGNVFLPNNPNAVQQTGVVGYVYDSNTGITSPVAAGGATTATSFVDGQAVTVPAIPARALEQGVTYVSPTGDFRSTNGDVYTLQADGGYLYQGADGRTFLSTFNYEQTSLTTDISGAAGQFNFAGTDLQTSYGAYGPELPTIGPIGGIGSTGLDVSVSDFSQVSGLGITNAPQNFASFNQFTPSIESTPFGYTPPTSFQTEIGTVAPSLGFGSGAAGESVTSGSIAFGINQPYTAPSGFISDGAASVGSPAAQIGSTEIDAPLLSQGGASLSIDGTIAGGGTPEFIGTIGEGGVTSQPLFQQIQPDAVSAGDFGSLGAGTPVGSGLLGTPTTESALGSTTSVSSLVGGGAGGAAGAAPTAATQAGQAQQAMQKGC